MRMPRSKTPISRPTDNKVATKTARTWWYVLLVVNLILILHLINGFYNLWRFKRLYGVRQYQTVKRYAMLAAKKNELDKVTSPAYTEVMLRENMQLYKEGEKLVIVSGEPYYQVDVTGKQEHDISVPHVWLEVFVRGIVGDGM